MKKDFLRNCLDMILIAAGAILYAVSFNLFMEPNQINAGGLTGLMMVVVKLTGFGTVGSLTILCNVPLFLLG